MGMRFLIPILLTFSSAALFAQDVPRSPTPPPVEAPLRVEALAAGLVHPWAVEPLPDGRLLVTERPGRLRIIGAEGKVSSPLRGVPEVFAQGQGGLLDVALSPSFESDRSVFLSYAEPGPNGTAGTAVARARLGDGVLEDVRVIWRQAPKLRGPNHFGSRIVFARDGTLFVTTGERFDHKAQDLSDTLGVVVRIASDGTVPRDNPFAGRRGARPEIWSYGHRNVQSAALHPVSGELWLVEHGPKGGDELQRAQAGANYGWPAQTFGVNYDGTPVQGGRATPQMKLPLYYWDPVIAPSGAVFLSESELLVGSLKPGGLVHLRLDGERVVEERRYREGALATRIRDLARGTDGALYAVTDERNGRLLRLRFDRQ
jgi:glucose/arabinose dehydrogenase